MLSDYFYQLKTKQMHQQEIMCRKLIDLTRNIKLYILSSAEKSVKRKKSWNKMNEGPNIKQVSK